MSKKLLMNNYSENGLMPVTDGLICWLDSRDECDGNKTVDRIGLNNFLLEGITASNLFCLENHALLSENSFILGNNFSIQLTINIKEIESFGLLLSHANERNIFKICHRNNSKLGCYTVATGGIDNGLPIIKDTKQIISVNIEKGIISLFDNNLLSSSINSLNNIDGKFRIGATVRNGYDGSNFTLYSLKIYDRSLTEEEIKQNYLYEQSIERGQ